MSKREEVEGQIEGLGYTIRRADSDDPNNYGQAPDLVSACVLAAALYQRTGYSIVVADEVGSSAAWIGKREV
jgi:hypothetical protein